MSYAYRVWAKLEWERVGLVNAVTSVISADMRVDMRAISFETRDGIFEVTPSTCPNCQLTAVPGVTVERLQEEDQACCSMTSKRALSPRRAMSC